MLFFALLLLLSQFLDTSGASLGKHIGGYDIKTWHIDGPNTETEIEKASKVPYYEALPVYMGTALDRKGSETVSYKASCFQNSTMSLKVNYKDNSAKVILDLQDPIDRTTHFDFYFTSGVRTFELSNLSQEEMGMMSTFGVRAFLYHGGVIKSLQGALAALQGFYDMISYNPSDQISFDEQLQNIEVLKQYMGIDPHQRDNDKGVVLSEEDVESGDVVALFRYDGLDAFLMSTTGSYVSHVGMVIKHGGETYVLESGGNPDGDTEIGCSTWKDWTEFRSQRQFNAALFPLRSEMRAKFNATNAWNYFKTLQHLPWGYGNSLFNSIDDSQPSFPLFLQPEPVTLGIHLFDYWKPEFNDDFFTEAFNKRLGTKDLTSTDALYEAWTRNMTIGDMMKIPEDDSWLYSEDQVPLRVCSAFVADLLIHGGLLPKEMSATEQTPRDVYMYDLYVKHPSDRPVKCQKADPHKAFCQLFGQWHMVLPGYSSVKPYPHMNERCPLVAPHFERPQGC